MGLEIATAFAARLPFLLFPSSFYAFLLLTSPFLPSFSSLNPNSSHLFME